MGDIVIDISGVNSVDGLVIGGIYRAEDFKRFGGGDPLSRAESPASESVVLRFVGVPPGEYAAAVYHDGNGNRRLDLNFVGIPAEGRGYSNVATAGLAAPSFDEARFRHDGETRLAIALRYPGQ